LAQQIIGGGPGGRPTVFRIKAKARTGLVDGNGNDVQWIYTVWEQYKSGSGYGSWSDLDVGAGFRGDAYNHLEDEQDDTSTNVTFNYNIDHGGADFPASMAMQSIKVGNTWPGTVVTNPDGSQEAWLSPYQSVDGTC